jgi:hypothetical protein
LFSLFLNIENHSIYLASPVCSILLFRSKIKDYLRNNQNIQYMLSIGKEQHEYMSNTI